MTLTVTTSTAADTVWGISTAALAARALQVAAELGVADHVGDEAVGSETLAVRCGTDAGSLDRVLRLLAAHGVFARTRAGWEHTDASRLLRSDDPRSMRAFARMMGLPVIAASVGALDRAVRTGRAGIEHAAGRDLWAHLHAHPDDAAVFDAAMEGKSHAELAAVLEAYDFSRFATVADIGGGRGHLLRAVLTRGGRLGTAPSMRGVLFDLPGVIAALDPPRAGLTHHAGDFFVDPLPAADAYVLMEVLHDWADGDAVDILRAVRRAAAPGATVVVIEAVVPDDVGDVRVHTLDLIMLAVTGGRERTVAEHGALLADAGFSLRRVVPTASAVQVVEAVAI